MSFKIEKISGNIKDRIIGISYPKGCSLSLDDLHYISVLHYDFNQNIKRGELIVNARLSEEIIDIFKEMYYRRYPIEKIILIDEYGGNDEKSMADNNSSCFNYRNIDFSNKISLHSFGMAIDINPLYNPYVRSGYGHRNILPLNAGKFVDRSTFYQGMIFKDDICYNSFIKRGWKWGGDWDGHKDYQHFYKK